MFETPVPDRRSGWRGLVLPLVGVALAVLLTIGFVQLRPASRSRPLSIASAEWAPYFTPGKNGNGPLAQVTEMVFQQAGFDPTFVFGTWTMAQDSLRRSGVLAVTAMVDSRERSADFLYSDPILDLHYTLFGSDRTLVGSLTHRNDLRGLKVGLVEGYSYWEELTTSGATFVTFPSTAAAFTAVAEGRVQLAAEDRVAGQAVLTDPTFWRDASSFYEAGDSKLTSAAKGLHVLFGKGAEGEQLRRSFDASLSAFKKSADYSRFVGLVSEQGEEVRLASSAGGPVNVFDADGAESGATPNGTRGYVRSWPSRPAASSLVSLKLVDGPLSGRIVWARLQDVELV